MHQVPALSDHALQITAEDRRQRRLIKEAEQSTAVADWMADLQAQQGTAAAQEAAEKLAVRKYFETIEEDDAMEGVEREGRGAAGGRQRQQRVRMQGEGEGLEGDAIGEKHEQQRQQGQGPGEGSPLPDTLSPRGDVSDELAASSSPRDDSFDYVMDDESSSPQQRPSVRRRLKGRVQKIMDRVSSTGDDAAGGEAAGSAAAAAEGEASTPGTSGGGGGSWGAGWLGGRKSKRLGATRHLEAVWDTGLQQAAEAMEKKLHVAASKAVGYLPEPVARKVKATNIFRKLFPGVTKKLVHFGQVGGCVGLRGLETGRAAFYAGLFHGF